MLATNINFYMLTHCGLLGVTGSFKKTSKMSSANPKSKTWIITIWHLFNIERRTSSSFIVFRINCLNRIAFSETFLIRVMKQTCIFSNGESHVQFQPSPAPCGFKFLVFKIISATTFLRQNTLFFLTGTKINRKKAKLRPP